jgi:molybdopterin-containing oxidoreductase family membrane subunit
MSAAGISASDPVIAPGLGVGELTDQISGIVLRPRPYRWWWWAMIPAATLSAMLVLAILWLFYAGIGIWGVDWPVVWGFALINYVWWIAIASGGTFISAMFYLLRVKWRTSLNRIAESMTLFAAACAGIYPILHLGRPWFFYWLLPYPDTMGLWPQFRSPLLWDFFAILTYVLASIMFWYLGLLPDLATLRDRATTRGRQVFFGVVALGFRGSGTEWRHFRAAYAVLAAIMAPLVCSVHSIVGLDFAAAGTVGWHSTQFPPFFVFGAMLSGLAAVLLWVIPLRHLLGLQNIITGRHLDVLGRLLLTSSLCIAYAYGMDVFMTYYGSDRAEHLMYADRIFGIYAPVYWGTVLFNVVLPQLLWFAHCRLNQALLFLVSFGVVVGMWMERYLIVVTSLHRPNLPSAWGVFHPSIWDWLTLSGTVGLYCAGMLLVVRFLPVASMFELRELAVRKQ